MNHRINDEELTDCQHRFFPSESRLGYVCFDCGHFISYSDKPKYENDYTFGRMKSWSEFEKES